MNTIIKLPTAPSGKGALRTEPVDTGVRTKGVYVIYTSLEATLAATRAAHDLATAMNVPLTVVPFRPVPYALPLTERTRIPSTETDALADRLRKEGIEAEVRVYLCRSERNAMAMTFAPHSLVVVGGRHAWWPLTRAAGWRRALEAEGHAVVSVDAAHYQSTGEGEARCQHAAGPATPAAGVAAFRPGLAGHSMKERAHA